MSEHNYHAENSSDNLGGSSSVDHDSHGGARHGRAAGPCHLDGIAASGCAGVGCTGVGRRSGRVGGAAASDRRSSELRDEQQAKQRPPSPPVDWQPEEEHCRHAHTAGGRVIIEYARLEDFDALLETIAGHK